MRPSSRSVAALAAVAASFALSEPANAADEVVEPGESIQAAIDDAQPGDTVSIGAGVFRENVTVTTNDITVRGAGSGRHGTVLMPPATPAGPCPEGSEVPGICVVGQVNPETGAPAGQPVRDVTVRDLSIDGFSGHGVFSFHAEDLTVAHVRASGNGGYGVVAFEVSGVRYLQNVAIRNREPGFYVGDSPEAQAVVVGNTAIENGVGGEGIGYLFRDASHGVVLHNKATRNCVGFVFLDSGFNEPTVATDWTAAGNAATRNNGACPAGGLPAFSGTGMLIAGAQQVVLRRNHVLGNRPTGSSPYSGGIVVVSGKAFGAAADASDNVIARNVALHNRPADIVWDEKGTGNSFGRNRCQTSMPVRICGG